MIIRNEKGWMMVAADQSERGGSLHMQPYLGSEIQAFQ
jgi:hypothetical protein